MSAMKGTESRCLDYLPFPLWMRILSFLPAASTPIVRAVCKYFLSVIDDPFFVTSHLRNNLYNRLETRTLTLCPSTEYTTLCNVLEADKTHLKWVENIFGDSGWSVAGSIDGILLMFAFDEALIWNPSIGRTRRIPCPSNYMNDFRFMRLGLGHDKSRNDYKALAIIDHTISQRNYVYSSIFSAMQAAAGAWVYSVKRGSWESVSMPTCRETREASGSLCFEGGLVWIEGVDTGHSYYHHLARFDFATNEFSYVSVPYPIKTNTWVQNRLVVIDGGASIGVWGLGSDDLVYIWEMDAREKSWTRLGNLDQGLIRIGAFRNREMIMEYWTKVVSRSKVSFYKDMEDVEGDDGGVMEYMGVYVESLLLS